MQSKLDEKIRVMRADAAKKSVLTLGLIVYCLYICYSAIHNINLMTKGLPEGAAQILGIVAVIGLELTALGLPIAVHKATDPLQKYTAAFFYFLVFLMVGGNVLADVATNSGSVPDWIKIYTQFGAPLIPLICAAMWSIFWLLDPSQKEAQLIDAITYTRKRAYLGTLARHAEEDAEIAATIESAGRLAAMHLTRQQIGLSPLTPQALREAAAIEVPARHIESQYQPEQPAPPPPPPPMYYAADSGSEPDDEQGEDATNFHQPRRPLAK